MSVWIPYSAQAFTDFTLERGGEERKGENMHDYYYALTIASPMLEKFIESSQNHRMAWGRRDLKDHLVPTP